MKHWDEFIELQEVIDMYMPMQGEGETMASQICTAVNKLIYKWYNDGDVYDNTFTLKGWANDLSSYANWLWKNVPESKDVLTRISDCHRESDYEDLLYELAERCLDTASLHEQSQKEKTGTIYNCTGRFFWRECYEEDDYWY